MSTRSLVNKYIVKVKRPVLDLHNVSDLKLEAKIYMHKVTFQLEKPVTSLTCAIVKTAQYQEENPPVAKLGKKIKTAKHIICWE